jgi:hypothetical protein
LPAGILKGVHLTVQNRAAALDPAIVSPADNFILVNKHRADGYPTFRLAQAGLFNSCLHE